MQERVNERMIAVAYMLGNLRVRVWVGCDLDWLPTQDEATANINLQLTLAHRDGVSDPLVLADRISMLDFVNAVEVLKPDGNGALVYPRWP